MFLYLKREWDREVSWELQFVCFPFLFHVQVNRNFQLVSLKIKLALYSQSKKVESRARDLSSEVRDFFREFEREMRAYFSGEKPYPDLPYVLNFSSFTLKVLAELRAIPAGEIITYGDLACKVGLKRGAKAIGQILARNPLPLIFPCHRVVSKNGLGGYSQGRLIKYLLLLHEKNTKF